MLTPLDTLEHLKARLREAAGELASSPGEAYVSLILDLPRVPTLVPQLDGSQFQFLHAHRDEQRAGYGRAGEWRAAGPDRFAVLREHARRLAASWRIADPDETGFTGFALLGFAARANETAPRTAAGLPNAMLWLPEAAVCTRRGQAALVLNARLPATRADLLRRWSGLVERLVPALLQPPPGPLRPSRLIRCGDTPGAAGWRSLVQGALDAIAAGELKKVVVARRLRIEGSRPFDLARLLAALTFFFPSCQVVNIRRGGASLVAATPERLLSLRGNRVEVDAVAGTVSRAAEVHRDGALARALQSSPKNRREHRLVVEAVCAALAPCASRIEAAAEPTVMQLNNAQHLWTRIGATLGTPADVFTLAERLHPTPATNGQPRGAASRWLQQADPFERGWYTGAAGLMEPDLSGELWVLLRCAEVRDHTADLYAGAGIVEGSDARLEWRETEHKLAAMLTALQFA